MRNSNNLKGFADEPSRMLVSDGEKKSAEPPRGSGRRARPVTPNHGESDANLVTVAKLTESVRVAIM